MIWLGVDFETTGLDTDNDRIIEVGAVLWDTDRKVPLCMFNEMVSVPDKLSPIITKLTGITDDDLLKWGHPADKVLGHLALMIEKCDHVIAHNGNSFDKPMWESETERHGIAYPDTPWLDSRVDVPYPDDFSSKRLCHLAMELGFINPFPHRALTDVLTMMKVVSHYDPKVIMEYQSIPNVTVRALVSFQNKDKAKARGYHWQNKDKIWTKTMKENELETERADADFDISIIGGNDENKKAG